MRDEEHSAARARRLQTVEGRIHRVMTPVGPSTPAAELSNLRHNVGRVGTFTVFHETRLSSAPASVNKGLGKSCSPYEDNITMRGELKNIHRNSACSPELMIALQEKILASVNVQWTSEHSSDLQMCVQDIFSCLGWSLTADTVTKQNSGLVETSYSHRIRTHSQFATGSIFIINLLLVMYILLFHLVWARPQKVPHSH